MGERAEPLNERTKSVLKAVIVSYIKTAMPVGSRTITKVYDFGLSPATIRNVMADLEDLGYLAQPHTSAGRIPTEKAYRLYVETVLSHVDDVPPAVYRNLLNEATENPQILLRETSRLLSDLSHYAGIVLAPSGRGTVYERIEFLPLRKDHLLVVFVSADGFARNRVIAVDRDYTADELRRASSLLNERFAGLELRDVQTRLIEEMKEDKTLYDSLLQRALTLGRKGMEEQGEAELYLNGASNMLDLPEFADVDRMKQIFKTFEEKATIVKLLNQCLDTTGVQVYIGSEADFPGVEGCSLVISPYGPGDHPIGSLGIIGPIRMDYERVIPIVDQTAKLLSRILEQA